MNILALDLSLVATGVCYPGGQSYRWAPKQKGVERLAWFYEHLAGQFSLGPLSADVALIEGYSFNSRNGGERLGELGGVVRLCLHRHGVPVVEVPPAVTKKFATGKGNASKDMVLLAAARRFPDFDGDNNQADALFLWALGNAKAGRPVVEMPKANLEALKAVEWPFPGGDA